MRPSKKFSLQTSLDLKMIIGLRGVDESVIIKEAKDHLLMQLMRHIEQEGMIDIKMSEGIYGNLEIRCSLDLLYPPNYEDPMWCKI